MIRNHVQNKLTNVIFTLLDTLLHVSIRLGKTKIALDAIEAGDKVLWVYPINAMMSGYQEDLIKFPPKSTDITFVNKSSLKKYANTHWDYVIVDEPQRCASAAQLKALKSITYKKRVGLSGTMNTKTLKKLQEELNWTVGAKYTLEDGIRDGIVKDYKVFIHFSELCDNVAEVEIKRFGKTALVTERTAYAHYCETMAYFDEKQTIANLKILEGVDGVPLTGVEKAAQQKSAFFSKMGFTKYMSLRTNLLYNSRCLLQAATSLISTFNDRKALIYALRTDVADQLSTKSFHSKNKDDEILEWFRTSDDGHLGVVDCVTTGITIKNLNTVVFHSYDSNTENLHQKLGRSLLYEHVGECANVHVCALKDTQNEVWIEKATQSLELDKIYYIIDGVTDTKINWLKKWHPEKSLFVVKESGGIVFHNGQNEDGIDLYSFLSQYKKPKPGEVIMLKGYPFKQQNLKQVA